MADSNMQLNWTEEQWNRVRQVVYEEARRTRVAGNFLPLFGPLSPDTTFVAREKVDEEYAPATSSQVRGIAVDDTNTLKLLTLQQFVYLKSSQVSDPDLSSALLAFRRAANRIARLEDEIVFRGQAAENMGAPDESEVVENETSIPKSVPSHEVSGGQRLRGLLSEIRRTRSNATRNGNILVSAVCEAIGDLEKDKFFGPYACILDNEYFKLANTPNDDSLVLPQDRILPFLSGGVLLRSSCLPKNTGVVIALSGEPVDLVVASDISVRFLQSTIEPRFVFRVSEKIVLRVKQEKAIRPLDLAIDSRRRVPRKTAGKSSAAKRVARKSQPAKRAAGSSVSARKAARKSQPAKRTARKSSPAKKTTAKSE